MYLVNEEHEELIASSFGSSIESGRKVEANEILYVSLKHGGLMYRYSPHQTIRDLSNHNGNHKGKLRIHLRTALANENHSGHIIARLDL